MANVPISNLPAATTLSYTDVTVWVVSGTTSKVTWASLVTALGIPWVTPQMFGAVANGVADDTTAIADAIAAVDAAGGGQVFFPGGTYLTGKQTLPSDIALIGENQASIVKLRNSVNDHLFYATGQSSITIRSLTLDGNKANQTIGALSRCFYALDCSDIRLEDVIAQNASDHGIHISVGTGTEPLSDSQRVWLKNVKAMDNGTNTATGNGGSGIAAICKYLWATDCYAEGNLLSGFKFSGAYVSAKGCYAIDNDSGGFSTGFDTVTEEGSVHVYEGCYALDNGNGTDGGDGFRHLGQVDRITHRDCTAIGNAWSGVCCAASSAVKPVEINIFGGQYVNNGQNFTPSSTVAGSGISVLSTVTAPDVPSYINISDVLATDDQGSPTQDYGIEIQDADNVYVGQGCRLDGNKISSVYNAATVVTGVRFSPQIIESDFIERTVDAVSVTGSTSETPLQTITIPANTLNPGQRYRIHARGTAAGTAGTKSFRLYFGNANALFSSQAAGDEQQWFLDGIVEITGASAQRTSFTGVEIGGQTASNILGSSDNANTAITCEITATLGSGSDTATCSSFFFEPIY